MQGIASPVVIHLMNSGILTINDDKWGGTCFVFDSENDQLPVLAKVILNFIAAQQGEKMVKRGHVDGHFFEN